MDGDAEGLADGSYEATAVGLDDGAEDLSTHSFLPAALLSFVNQQQVAILQTPTFPGNTKHSEMNSQQAAL